MVARSAPKMEARSGPKMEAGSGPKMEARSVPKMEAHNAPKMETHSAPITGVPMGAPNVFFVNKEKNFGHPPRKGSCTSFYDYFMNMWKKSNDYLFIIYS